MVGDDPPSAQEAIRYHAEVVRPGALHAGRREMAADLRDLYVRRLHLPEGADRAEPLVAAIEDPSSVLVEVAHDGQLPHLGVVRMVLHARHIATSVRQGLAVYLIGDHYSAEMRPRNLYVGLPLRGVDADHVKTPLTISVGKASRHVPFVWLPPPSSKHLDDLERRAQAWTAHNASFAGRRTSGPKLQTRLHGTMEMMRECARVTKTFGDWLIRLQVLLFDELFGGPPPNLAFLPMSGLRGWMPAILKEIADAGSRARGETVHVQRPAGTWDSGFSSERGDGTFWVHCPTCRRRLRASWAAATFASVCPSCRRSVEARWPEDRDLVFPGVVPYEMALFRSGIAGWVVGSRATYIPEIDRSYREVYGTPMPPVIFQTSVPRFWGMGEPSAGHKRARLVRVLLEMNPLRVREDLEGPWNENPALRSEHL